jgi:alpha-glucoside transport system substrate-binding protein
MWRIASVTAAVALALAACAPRGQPERLGGTVSVLAVWGGEELESFRAMLQPFEERTGVTVEYEGTRDLNAVLTTRVQAGNPPDVAVLPGPGQLAEFARQGHLVPLDDVVDAERMRQEYAQTWLDLGTVDGRLYGVFVKTSLKGLVWYNRPAFEAAGYTVPQTWDDLMRLTERIAADGRTPWCVGLESGSASGWPATDWIEVLLLKAAGPEVYDRWYRHEISWEDSAVRQAWERFAQVVGEPRYVYGGRQGVLATNFAQAAFPLFSDPPGCYLHHQATFIQDFIQQQFPNLRPGEDFDFFPFPAVDARYQNAVVAAGDLVGVFRDTPQARALVRYLASAEAQAVWVRRGGALSPNRQVSLDGYPDPLSRRAAEVLRSAEVARFDASDLMPEAVNSAFWRATLDFVQEPRRLGALLARLERVAREAYR